MLSLFLVRRFFHLFLVGVVWFHNRVPLGPAIPGIILLYDVLYTWHVFIYTERCCRCCCCCCAPVLLLLQKLLSVIVRRTAKTVAGSLNLMTSNVFFLFIQTQFIFDVCTTPLGSTIEFTALICLYNILGNCRHARSQGGHQPAALKPPLCVYVYLYETLTRLISRASSRMWLTHTV